MLKKACNVVGNGVLVVCGAVALWVVLSWVDVVLHNLDTNPVYQSWNLFAMMVGMNQGSNPSILRSSLAYVHDRGIPRLRENMCSHKKEQKKNVKK